MVFKNQHYNFQEMSSGQPNQAPFQILYYQLLSQYYILAENYHNQAEQNFRLYKHLETLLQENLSLTKEEIPTQANLPITPLPHQECSFVQFEPNIEDPKKTLKNKNIAKREARLYRCPYNDCTLVYHSSVSMNLHIKLKHKGGSKKQRQAVAKILIQAEEKGLPAPKIDINLPPSFIQEFKKNYEYAKKYNM